MSAPLAYGEKESSTDWVFGEQWPHLDTHARRMTGDDILRRVWGRIWCDPLTVERDHSLALVERLRELTRSPKMAAARRRRPLAAPWRYCPDCGKRYERDTTTAAGDYCPKCRGAEVDPCAR